MRKVEDKHHHTINTFFRLFGFFTIFIFYFNTSANIPTDIKTPTITVTNNSKMNTAIDTSFIEAFRQFERWHKEQMKSEHQSQFESFDRKKLMAFFKEATENPSILIRHIAFSSHPVDEYFAQDFGLGHDFHPFISPKVAPKLYHPKGYPAHLFKTFFIFHFDLNNKDHLRSFAEEHHAMFQDKNMESPGEFKAMVKKFLEESLASPMTSHMPTAGKITDFDNFKPVLYSMAMRDVYSSNPKKSSFLLLECMREDMEAGNSDFIVSSQFQLPSREEDTEGFRREVFTHIVNNFFQKNTSSDDEEASHFFKFGFHRQPSDDQNDGDNQIFEKNSFQNTVALVKWLNEEDFMEIASNFMEENHHHSESF